MEASMNQYLQIGNMMVSGAISKQLAQAIIEGNVQIVESLMTKGSETVYTLTLDCTQSLSDLIAQGKYDFVNDNITEKNFPIECSGETIKMALEVILVHLDERLTTKRVKHELDRRGLKLAPIDILLALGAAESDLHQDGARGNPRPPGRTSHDEAGEARARPPWFETRADRHPTRSGRG